MRLADARKTLDRNRSLVERALVSRSVLDASEAEAAALGARLEAARADVGVAQARLAVAQQGLDDLLIRAPFAGVVISKDAQPGETVSPVSAGGGFTRTGIATIVDMGSREIEVDVNEAYINRVRDGQRAEATLDAYPDWKVPGRVMSIVPTADRQKATVRVRIAFEQLDPRILPDMGIKVRFLEERSAAGSRTSTAGKSARPCRCAPPSGARPTAAIRGMSPCARSTTCRRAATRARSSCTRTISRKRAAWPRA